MDWSAMECPSVLTTAFYSQTQWCLCTTEPSWPSRKPQSLWHRPTSSETQTSAHRPPFYFGINTGNSLFVICFIIMSRCICTKPSCSECVNQFRTNTNTRTQSCVFDFDGGFGLLTISTSLWVAELQPRKTNKTTAWKTPTQLVERTEWNRRCSSVGLSVRAAHFTSNSVIWSTVYINTEHWCAALRASLNLH